MKQSFIYGLTCPIAGKVRYIGKTVEPEKRLYMHVYYSKNRDTHKERWISNLIAAGLKPGMLMLEAVPASGDWKEAERRWIKKATADGWPLTNITIGGDGMSPLNEEAVAAKKAQMSKPETRARMSASAKARWADPEKRQKGLFVIQSNERRQKLSEQAKRRATPEYRIMMSERSKAAWADDGKRANITSGITEETRKTHSASAKRMWDTADQSKKERMLSNLLSRQSQ